jgi:hypothetical protein
MLRGFRWLGLAGVVVIAALVGPTAALADSCSDGSATSIYTDCVPTASGGHHSKPPVKHSQPTVTTPYIAPPYVAPVVQVTHKAKHAIAHSGTDKKVLKNIVSNPNLVDSKRLKPVLASAPVHESSLGSAVDLGAGPTVFFALLLGTVLVLLGAGGVRSWRNRHRV